jgi:hypothetical protein
MAIDQTETQQKILKIPLDVNERALIIRGWSQRDANVRLAHDNAIDHILVLRNNISLDSRRTTYVPCKRVGSSV